MGQERMHVANVFDAAGGEETFRRLVKNFYGRVATDPILRAVYPEDDLSGATERLTLFLIQYWDGPSTYSEQRGHPRLRLRHQPFAIGQRERRLAGPDEGGRRVARAIPSRAQGAARLLRDRLDCHDQRGR